MEYERAITAREGVELDNLHRISAKKVKEAVYRLLDSNTRELHKKIREAKKAGEPPVKVPIYLQQFTRRAEADKPLRVVKVYCVVDAARLLEEGLQGLEYITLQWVMPEGEIVSEDIYLHFKPSNLKNGEILYFKTPESDFSEPRYCRLLYTDGYRIYGRQRSDYYSYQRLSAKQRRGQRFSTLEDLLNLCASDAGRTYNGQPTRRAQRYEGLSNAFQKLADSLNRMGEDFDFSLN